MEKTIFISGSAEHYGAWSKKEALSFIHLLSKSIILADFKIVNGFGWGVGSAVFNGALEAIYERPGKYSKKQLLVRPFPQIKTGNKELPKLWAAHRQNMISLAGIAIFVFGNKMKDGKLEIADGVDKEFRMAISQGLIPIPIGATGYVTKNISDEILETPKNFYSGMEWIIPIIEELADPTLQMEEMIKKVMSIIKMINNG